MSTQTTNRRIEIIVTGFGGQGIILAGRILGMSASLGDKKESTLVQAYGPESRGGACNAQVIISDVPMANVNNLLLKKVKIALTLTNEDMLEILESAGVTVSKSELSAVLRKEGHRNYKPCGDRYARNFLKGLALRYRG